MFTYHARVLFDASYLNVTYFWRTMLRRFQKHSSNFISNDSTERTYYDKYFTEIYCNGQHFTVQYNQGEYFKKEMLPRRTWQNCIVQDTFLNKIPILIVFPYKLLFADILFFIRNFMILVFRLTTVRCFQCLNLP